MVLRSLGIVVAFVFSAAGAWGQATSSTLRLERVEATSRSLSVGTATHKVEQSGNSFTVSLTYAEARGTGTMNLKVDLPNASFTDARTVTGGLQLTPNPTFQLTGTVNGTGVAGGGEYEVKGTTTLGNQPTCTAQVPPEATRPCQLGVLGLQSNLARITITLNLGYAVLTATAHYSYRPAENSISFGTRPARAVNPGQLAVDPLPGGVFYGKQDVSAIVAYGLATQQDALTVLELSTDAAGEEPLARSAPHPVSRGRDSGEIQYEAITLLTSGYVRDTPQDGRVYLRAVLLGTGGAQLAESAPVEYSLAPGPKLEYRVEGPSYREPSSCGTVFGPALPAPIVLHASYTVPSGEPERAKFTLVGTGLGLDGRARLLFSETIRDDVPPETEVTFDFRKLQIPLRDVSQIAILLYGELASSGTTLISEAHVYQVECVAVTGSLPLRARTGEMLKVPISWSIWDPYTLGVYRDFPPASVVEFRGSRPLGSALDEVQLPPAVKDQSEYVLDYYHPKPYISPLQVRIALEKPVAVSPPAVQELPKAKLDIVKADNSQTVVAHVEPSALVDVLGQVTGATPSAAPKVKFASASIAQLPPFLGVQRTWVFEPGIARDGSFAANLTLSYDADVLPDHPGFDESKLEMVAYDPASGDIERLMSTLDLPARTVTARIDRLARVYSLVVFGPFTRSLLAAPALPAGGGFQAGLSVVNPDAAATALEVRAFRTDAVDLQIPLAAGQQVTGVLGQLIPALADTPGAWVLARGGVNTVAAQLLHAGTAFDVIPLQSAASASSVFPNVRRQPNAVSTLFVANPDAAEVRVDLTVFGLDGSVAATQSFVVQPSQDLQLPLDRTFPDLPADFAGYAVLKSQRAVFVAHVLLGRGAMAGSNALPVPVGSSRGPVRLFAAHLGDESATLALVNTGSTEARVTVRGYVEAGGVFSGTPVELLLAPGQGWQSTLNAAFRTGTLPGGSIVVESESELVAGELLIGDPSLGRLAVLPLVASGAGSVVIPYFANDSPFQTALVIAGTGTAVNATVTAHRADGSTIGAGNVTVATNGVSNLLLSSLISGTAGQRGGYLRISANQPFLAYADVSSTGADHALILGQAAVGSGGSGGGSAPISVGVSSVDLGSAALSTSGQPGTVQITNSGSASVTVTVSTSGPFTAAPATLTIAAGGTGVVTVTFRPVASTPTRQEGTLTLAVSGATVATVALVGTVSAPPAAVCVSAPPNLVSFFPGDGNGSDIVGGNNATLTSGASYAAGRVGQAFQFDGANGHGQVGNPANLRFTNAMSIEAWINLRSGRTGVLSSVVTKWSQIFTDTPDSDSWGLWVNNTAAGPRLFSAIHATGARETTVEGGVVPLNTWTHVAMTYDGGSGRYRLYVNGQQTASQTFAGVLYASNRNILIGREDSFQTRAFDGLIDELSLYGRELTAAEIQGIFNAAANGKCKPAAIPSVTVSPASLDFGSVTVATASQSRQVSIRNTGSATVNTTLQVSGTFAVTPSTLSLTAGGTGVVSVTFNPLTATPARQEGSLSVSALGTALASVSLSGTAVAAPACLAAPSNLVSFFPGDGNGSDIVGGSNATLTSGASYGVGRVGQAFQFDGANGHAQVGNPSNLKFTNAVSIEAWINLRSGRTGVLSSIVTKWGQIFSDTPDSDSWGLWVNNTSAGPRLFSAIHATGARETTVEGGAIPLNTWTHVAMTYDGPSGRYRLYVNGQQTATQTFAGTLYASNRNVLIGREDSFQTRAFDGLIDEVSLYGRELTASEVQGIFSAAANGKCKGGTTTPPPPIGGYSVTVTPTTVASGRPVTVSWTDPGPNFTRNWVGLFQAEATPSSSTLLRPAWVYTERASGTVEIAIPAGTAPGRYVFHYFTNDGYGPIMASSSVITVTP